MVTEKNVYYCVIEDVGGRGEDAGGVGVGGGDRRLRRRSRVDRLTSAGGCYCKLNVIW